MPGTGGYSSSTANYWAITRIIITPTSADLYLRPDDPGRKWTSKTFTKVCSTPLAQTEIRAIKFSQPWDSTCYVDYVKVIRTSDPQKVSVATDHDGHKD